MPDGDTEAPHPTPRLRVTESPDNPSLDQHDRRLAAHAASTRHAVCVGSLAIGASRPLQIPGHKPSRCNTAFRRLGAPPAVAANIPHYGSAGDSEQEANVQWQCSCLFHESAAVCAPASVTSAHCSTKVSKAIEHARKTLQFYWYMHLRIAGWLSMQDSMLGYRAAQCTRCCTHNSNTVQTGQKRSQVRNMHVLAASSASTRSCSSGLATCHYCCCCCCCVELLDALRQTLHGARCRAGGLLVEGRAGPSRAAVCTRHEQYPNHARHPPASSMRHKTLHGIPALACFTLGWSKRNVPATNTLAPACAATATVPASMPPSTCTGRRTARGKRGRRGRHE